jgi:drug/metabolite transporter (DMT)-like permease
MKLPRPSIIIAYLTIYIVWGSTYLAMRWVVESLSAYYLVGARFFFGGLVFLIISLISGRLKRLPTLRETASAAFLGIFLLIGGNGLVSVGLLKVDSYLAAIIISATPFCVAVFNRVLFSERISSVRLFGIILGFAGVVAILYNGTNPFENFEPYIGFLIGGFLSWGFATSVGHKLKVHSNNLVNSGMQMFIAGIIALVMSQFMYAPLPELIQAVSLRSLWALVYLITIGSAAYYAYTYLIANEPSIRIVSYAIVNPLIAVLLGLVFAHEKPVPLLAIGMPVILVGLAFMLYGEPIREALLKRIRKKKRK